MNTNAQAPKISTSLITRVVVSIEDLRRLGKELVRLGFLLKAREVSKLLQMITKEDIGT